uniref:Uncharacterized protein n=1 Tax=Solanum lycopersicum TaxID=4081 RepID=A0A3Q7H6V9_SOLLC
MFKRSGLPIILCFEGRTSGFIDSASELELKLRIDSFNLGLLVNELLRTLKRSVIFSFPILIERNHTGGEMLQVSSQATGDDVL